MTFFGMFLLWGWFGCSFFIHSLNRNNETFTWREIIPLLYLSFKYGPFIGLMVD